MDRLRLNESRGGNILLKTYNIVNEVTTTYCSYQYHRQNSVGFRWNGLNSQDARAWNNLALRWAAENGHLDVLKWLVSTFNLNSEDVRSDDNRALQLAAEYGHLDVLKWLVSTFNLNSDDVRSRNNYALQWAASEGHLDVVKYLCGITGDPVSRWIDSD